tara:strand:+ start:493 stop:2451 length:1959 start_codon:yes stop_codon:yes gene_type:complete
MLTVSNLSKSYGERNLFSDLSFSVTAKTRIALIGPNGCGKTTLLDILSGEAIPDTGKIIPKRNTTIGYLKQELPALSDHSLLQAVIDQPSSITELQNKISNLENSTKSHSNLSERDDNLLLIGELEQDLQQQQKDLREHEAKAILSGLGFLNKDFSKSLNQFSGGWIMRAVLAKLLFKQPDILLLDEPTNHLDLEANLWFEKYLLSFPGIVIIASHDRIFLNNIATSVLAIDTSKVLLIKGNYDDYLRKQAHFLQAQTTAAVQQKRERDKQMQFVERFRSKARKASQVQSRLKQLQRLTDIEVPRATKRVHYKFPEPKRSGTDVITLKNIVKSYGDHLVYENLNLTLQRGDKVALVGPNGAGKTTLLKILAGALPFENGTRKLGHNVSPSYYAQHLLELLSPGNTLLEELRDTAPSEDHQSLRNILGGFLFTGDAVSKQISVLSGGEKARIALAKLLVQPSNLLFMDEPTNHLDIVSREILIDALTDYKGTVCFITHDRSLIHQVANKIISIDQGIIYEHPGNYASYLLSNQQRDSNTLTIQNAATTETGNSQSQKPSNEHYYQRKDLQRKLRSLETKVKNIEETLEIHETNLKDLETQLSNATLQNSLEELALLGKNHKESQIQLNTLWQEWEKLSFQAKEVQDQLIINES